MLSRTARRSTTAICRVFFRQMNDPEALRMAAFTPKDPADRDAFDAHWERIRASAGRPAHDPGRR